MPQATVNIKFVNQPRQVGGRFGSLKDAAGEYWSVPAAMLAQFSPNTTVTVEYDTSESNGRTFKNVKKIIPPAPGAPVARNGADGPWQLPNFVSNVVGQAIASGRIQSPAEIKVWTLAAKYAGEIALGLKKEEPEGMDPAQGGYEPDDLAPPF